MIFRDQRTSGALDLEAIEMAVRSAMHHAGAAMLSELLRFAVPTAEQRKARPPRGWNDADWGAT